MNNNIWTFYGKNYICSYSKKYEGSFIKHSLIEIRDRKENDPPFIEPKGRWEQKGKTWILFPDG